MSLRVVGFGELLVDLLETPAGWVPQPGGAPANVVCALARWGHAVGLVTALGTDVSGEMLTALLQRRGVDLRGVQLHPTVPTRRVEVRRDTGGDRRFGGFEGRDTREFADAHIQAAAIPDALFEQLQLLVCGTIPLAYPESAAALEHCLTRATAVGAEVLLDVNWRPMFWSDPVEAPERIRPLLERVVWLKLTREEAEWLFATSDPAAIAREYPHLQGVLITDGSQGCRWWLAGHSGETPAFRVRAVDTTGAGDSFVAGFIHRLLTDRAGTLVDPAAAIRWASAAGALTTLTEGAIAAQPTLDRIAAFLEDCPQ
jgi:fructokinase